MRRLLDRLWQEWQALELQVEELSREIESIARADAACRRLQKIPGVGPLVATAVVAAIGNGAAFRKGREFAAWLGLVPRQHSTGGRARLLGISKRGNSYPRRLFIHGARSVVLCMKRDQHAIGEWITQIEMRTHANVMAVAVANKLARIAWAVLSRGDDYCGKRSAVAA
jgi:transposase